jgi:hypothetical protein
MNAPISRRPRRRILLFTFLLLFLLPAAASAGLLAYEGGPRPWWTGYDRTATNLPAARSEPEARIMVMAGRTRGWKGAVALHSWIVIKPAHASAWRRYDVVGWGGTPVRTNWWGPDTWFGERPMVVLDVKGAQAEALIPKVEAAIKSYRYAHDGDYRIWPGPNSNTFIAALLRAIPEAGATLPPNAIGRDFRPLPYAGLTDSGTGVEFNLWGMLGLKVAWVEGFEVNVGGFVAGLDLRHPGIKLPGFGRIGIEPGVALAGPQRS